MALASQQLQRSGRSGLGGRYISTRRLRRRRRIRWIAGSVVAAMVVWFAWGWLFGADSPSTPGPAPSPVPSPPAAVTPRPSPGPSVSTPRPPLPVRPSVPPPTPPVVTPTPPVVTPTPAPPPPVAVRNEKSGPEAKRLMKEGQSLVEDGKWVEGRRLLNQALHGAIGQSDAERVRGELARLNQLMVFSPRVLPGDPHVDAYIVKSGDMLQKIGQQHNTPWRFVSRINNDLNPKRLQLGKRLKIVRGPFHAVVHKRDFRVDVYLDDLYIRSFTCGLGEFGSTPVGHFIVRRHSKLINPEWTNPRSGKRFLADDPKNPIGEYWIGLKGTDKETELLSGYGLHGTIEPDSIGQERSMGCVRMLNNDVALLFDMLTEGQSRVEIRN